MRNKYRKCKYNFYYLLGSFEHAKNNNVNVKQRDVSLRHERFLEL